MLSQLFQYLLNSFHILFAFIFSIDEDIIEVHYHKNVEFFCQDLINVVLKCDRCIGQSKRHYLVFKMAIAAFKGHFLFIVFFDPHLIVTIG